MRNIGKKVFKSGLIKNDVKKVRYSLIPFEVLKRVAEQFARGAEKYGENNWRLGSREESSIFRDAAYRHLVQWVNNLDQEEDHAAALIANVMMHEWINNNK